MCPTVTLSGEDVPKFIFLLNITAFLKYNSSHSRKWTDLNELNRKYNVIQEDKSGRIDKERPIDFMLKKI